MKPHIQVTELRSKVKGLSAQEAVTAIVKQFGESRVVLASSLSIEDQVLTHMMVSGTPNPRVFTLDTGRLFPEFYHTLEDTMMQLSIHFEILVPDSFEVEQMVNTHGPDLFYKSVPLRKLCCEVRKLHPLSRVLSTADVWICGLRRSQAVTRTAVELVEWDDAHGLIKVNPLYDWSESEVWEYLHAHNIPYNQLYNKGFRSIGCAPCTRAVENDDDVRAGRWWWEEPEHRECGLHNRPVK